MLVLKNNKKFLIILRVKKNNSLANIDFIEFNRKLFNPVTAWSLLLKLYEIMPNRKEMNIKYNMNLIYKF